MTADKHIPSLQRYGGRVVLLYLFSVLFKSFDLSFSHEIFAFQLRGQFFSVLWIAYGLVAWWLGSSLVSVIEKRMGIIRLPVRFLVLGIVMTIYGLPVVLLFSYIYRLIDIHLFNNAHLWTNITAFDYQLNVGLLIHFLLMLTINGLNYYYRNALSLGIQAERLMKENLQARYDSLRQQIEPHFFFNSLSVLTNLVYRDADLSAQYVTQLAKLYRYILERKIENVVPLTAELEFLKAYIFLINIRHQDEVQFKIELSDQTLERTFIPPATLQILVENAIKHNRFSKSAPLRIVITESDDGITVTNNLSKREVPTSLGIGLENVKKRFELIGANSIAVKEDADHFQVKIPKLLSVNYEGINS